MTNKAIASEAAPIRMQRGRLKELKHDPEKCWRLSEGNHAQSKNQSAMTIHPNLIALQAARTVARNFTTSAFRRLFSSESN
ncbi:hypothetical protein [Bradyrhizobium sp.]|uniref:hypothetical protein n=1 Tax=Bradyrhizobium sp. TaxID=376 RepID=UPI003C73A853